MNKVTSDMQEEDLIKILSGYTNIIDSDPITVFSFLLNLQENPIKISQKYATKIHEEANKLQNILREKLNEQSFPLIKLMSEIKFQEIEVKEVEVEEFDLYKTIMNIISEVLLKNSSKEIENIVHSHFNPKKRYHTKLKNIDEMLYKVTEIKDKQKKRICIENLIVTFEMNDAKKILEFFIKRIEKTKQICENEAENPRAEGTSTDQNLDNHTAAVPATGEGSSTTLDTQQNSKLADINFDLSLFFNILYLKNKNFYDKFMEIIFNESFFTRFEIIKILPKFDLNLKNNFYSENLLKYVLEFKPIERQNLIDFLNENKKKLLLKFIKDFYFIFDLKSLNLSFEEHIDICKSVDENVFYLFENFGSFANNLNAFINLLLKKDDDFVILFFKKYLNSQNIFYEKVVTGFLKLKRLSEQLQVFFVETFLQNDKIVEISEDLNQENVKIDSINTCYDKDKQSQDPQSVKCAELTATEEPLHNDQDLQSIKSAQLNVCKDQVNTAHDSHKNKAAELIDMKDQANTVQDSLNKGAAKPIDMEDQVNTVQDSYNKVAAELIDMEDQGPQSVKFADPTVKIDHVNIDQNVLNNKAVENTDQDGLRIINDPAKSNETKISEQNAQDPTHAATEPKIPTLPYSAQPQVYNQNFTANPLDINKYTIYLQASFVKEIFFILSPYVKNQQLISNLEKFCVDEFTLIEFLKVLSPEEIYLNVHYFKDIKKSLHITQLISKKKEIFNISVCKYCILEMEKKSLPPLFMRTVIISLINFESMKDFVLSLMFRLVQNQIWNNKQLYSGFVKCLSFLGNSAFEIIMCMPEDRMKDVLNDEKMLLMSEKYIKKSGLKGRCAFLFKNTVYKQLKRRKQE